MIPAITREDQLSALARFYRRNHETEAAVAIEWALAELAQRDVMLSEAIDRQIWLEQLTESLQRLRAA